MFKKNQTIHFVGIGGIGMSGIAEVLLNIGYRVTGSDIEPSSITRHLESLGCTIWYHHAPEHVNNAHVVVTSSAIREDNPEVVQAYRLSLPVIPRAEMLAELMRMKYSIAVAGSHGKTTTTSLIATILAYAGLDPTVVIGGRLNNLGSNAVLGQGSFLVAEADESDGSFLKLLPTIAVVTNIDREHLDFYTDLQTIQTAFLDFINKVSFYGAAVICADEQNVCDLIPKINRRFVTYGLCPNADFRANNICQEQLKTSFEVYKRNELLGKIQVLLAGEHNVVNCLAAIAVADELEIEFPVVAEALAKFSGVERRFRIRQVGDILIVDDYAHHPREIQVTLQAAKAGWDKRLVVAFQPHRYTRTRDLWREFGPALQKADVLVVSEIYPAGEDPIPNISGRLIYQSIRETSHPDATFIKNKDEIIPYLLQVIQPGDMVMFLGAGDIWKLADVIAEKLKQGRIDKSL